MNDNLKNFSANPDPQVWDDIQQTLRRRTVRRRAAAAGIAAVIVAAAIVTVTAWPSQPQSDITLPEVAQVTAPAIEATVPESAPVAAAVTPAPVQTKAVASTPAEKVAEPEAQAVTADVAPAPVSATATRPVENVTKVVPAPARAPRAAQAAAVETAATTAAETEAAVSNQPEVRSKSPIVTNVADTILWIPNIIVPGSDDENLRVFRPRLSTEAGSITNYRLTIYNRAGNQVFFSNSLEYYWDGTYKGSTLPQASYVYIIYYTDRDNLQHQRKGTVTLVR